MVIQGLPRQVWSLVALLVVLAVACGSSATATPPPTNTPGSEPTATTPADGETPGPTAAPTVGATVTPVPTGVVSARDSITLVVPEEPVQINSHRSVGAALNQIIVKDNLVESLTWQSGDDQRIVPTGATTGWEQLDATTWRFTLREGVKFHNGEDWNAEAALPNVEIMGSGTSGSQSFPYTGGFTAEAVDDYTLDIICEQACPVFPNTAFFTGMEAPEYLETSTPEELARNVVGFGPYRLVEWTPGVSITEEIYEDYVPAGNHYEFQTPYIQNLEWVWRSETPVMLGMIQAGEADIAWDVGVDAADELPEDMLAFGSSAETFAFTLNTIWHPELSKKEVRQAIAHAIDCQQIVDTLYNGLTSCRGNIIFPGVIGASDYNTAPYEYDPERSMELLAQAGYDPDGPDSELRISGRATRIPKQVELYETVDSYLDQVGINSTIDIIESSIRTARTGCGIGHTVNLILEESGRTPGEDEPTTEDYQAALEHGLRCDYGELMENEPSNETLDFGRNLNQYMNCIYFRSLVCDPTPGGIQEKIAPAMASAEEDRQRLMEELADILHDDVLLLGMFDLPVVYGKDPKLNFQPRFDGRVRASHLWFSP